MPLSFTEAMNNVCPLCDTGAKFHRLDSRHYMYCLVLNSSGKMKQQALVDLGYPEWEPHMYYQLPTEYLKESPLSLEVGQVLNRALRAGADEG